MEEEQMEINDFKDWLFDLINDAADMDAAYIETDDRNNTFIIGMPEGGMFEIHCKKIQD